MPRIKQRIAYIFIIHSATASATNSKPQQWHPQKMSHSKHTQCGKSIFIRYIELVRTFIRSRKIHISLFSSLLFVYFCFSFMKKKALKSHKIPECWFVFVQFICFFFSRLFSMRFFFSFNEIVSLISGDLCALVGDV